MEKAKIGIIGLGKQGGGEFLSRLHNSQHFHLQAICDINENNLLKAKQECDAGVTLYRNPTEMLEKENLNSVILALPHDQYLDVITLAAKQRINILKEKPYAIDVQEGDLITEIVRESGINFMVSCQFRFDPLYIKIKQLLNDIGHTYLIKFWYNISSPNPNANWRAYKNSAGGGVLLDIGYHLIDLVLWYFGKPSILFAQSSNKFPERYEVEDTASLNIGLNNNVKGDITVSCIYPYKNVGLLFAGDNGSIFCQNKKIELRDANCKITESMDFSGSSSSSTDSVLAAFAKSNLAGHNSGYMEAEYHNENHMRLIEDAYQIIKMVNQYETGYKWWKSYHSASL